VDTFRSWIGNADGRFLISGNRLPKVMADLTWKDDPSS
jgi:hypothetical protein